MEKIMPYELFISELRKIQKNSRALFNSAIRFNPKKLNFVKIIFLLFDFNMPVSIIQIAIFLLLN